jgi:Na+/proline symporter
MYWKGAHRLGALCSLVLGGSATFIYFLVDDPVAWTGTIGVLSYVAAFVGMVVGSLIGRRALAGKRLAFAGAVLLLAGLAWFALSGANPAWVWRGVWLAVLALVLLIFVSLSSYAGVKGFGEIQQMFRQLLPQQEPKKESLPTVDVTTNDEGREG